MAWWYSIIKEWNGSNCKRIAVKAETIDEATRKIDKNVEKLPKNQYRGAIIYGPFASEEEARKSN